MRGEPGYNELEMNGPLHITTRVLPGNRIEVQSSQFAVGEEVDVAISAKPQSSATRTSFLDNVRNLPPCRLFKTPQQVDAYIREERDSWDR